MCASQFYPARLYNMAKRSTSAKEARMKRRYFLGLAAASAAASPRMNVANVRTRKTGKVDVVYKSPHAQPNGLQATREGLWVMDQGKDNWVSLVNFADGKLIREFKGDVVAASGLTVDDKNRLWMASTYSCTIVSCNAADGKTIAKYWTPGAGRIYPQAGDPPQSRTTLKPAYPPDPSPAPAALAAKRAPSAALPAGQLPLDTTQGLTGTGAHGMEYRDGLLYFVVPPARTAYVMDPATWVVQDAWPLPGNRPHGIGWEGDTLWISDSNLRAFFRHNIKTGEIVEKIQLTERDPIIHGATVRDGYMWYCDDVGWICNFKL
jgi:hypothetical protein